MTPFSILHSGERDGRFEHFAKAAAKARVSSVVEWKFAQPAAAAPWTRDTVRCVSTSNVRSIDS
jgi:hypothetical protein